MAMAEMLGNEPGLAAIELNISCPNVSHGLDLGIDAGAVGRLVSRVRGRVPAADHRQADAERDRHRADRRRPRPRPAPTPSAWSTPSAAWPSTGASAADPGLRRRRTVGPGDQADRPADGLGRRPRLTRACRSSASAASPRPTTPSSSSSRAPRPSRSAPPPSTTRPRPNVCSIDLTRKLDEAEVGDVRSLIGTLRSNRG